MKKYLKNMTKVFKSMLFIFTIVIINSCDEEIAFNEKQTVEEQSTTENLLFYRIEFGKILARAIEELDLRKFLKVEALKEFDNDYDILVQMVKNSEVGNGRTFLEILKKYDNKNILDEILSKSPLITIYIPDLVKFSPNTWDTEHDNIPLIAIRNNEEKKTIKMFNKNGEASEHELDKEPDFPVLVIKENERVMIRTSNSNNRVADQSHKEVIESNHFSFQFISEDFIPKEENGANERRISPAKIYLYYGRIGDVLTEALI